MDMITEWPQLKKELMEWNIGHQKISRVKQELSCLFDLPLYREELNQFLILSGRYTITSITSTYYYCLLLLLLLPPLLFLP